MATHTSASAAGTGSTTPRPASGKTNAVVLTLMAAVFLALLDSQIIATALPRVIGDLGGLDQFAWATTGYLIGGSAALPVYGKLGDLFGRKRIFVGSLVAFLLASAACGLAQTMGQLIAFRVVQGIGSGGLFICVLAIIGEMFGYREGARYYGWISITFGAASIAGPTLGGVLTELASWRWVFFVNLPIGAVVLFVVVMMLDLPARPQKARIDYAGVVLLTIAIVALNLFMRLGRRQVRLDLARDPRSRRRNRPRDHAVHPGPAPCGRPRHPAEAVRQLVLQHHHGAELHRRLRRPGSAQLPGALAPDRDLPRRAEVRLRPHRPDARRRGELLGQRQGHRRHRLLPLGTRP